MCSLEMRLCDYKLMALMVHRAEINIREPGGWRGLDTHHAGKKSCGRWICVPCMS